MDGGPNISDGDYKFGKHSLSGLLKELNYDKEVIKVIREFMGEKEFRKELEGDFPKRSLLSKLFFWKNPKTQRGQP